MLTILTKKVGEELKLENIELPLAKMQELVGGYIERVALPYDIDLWLNEEGKLSGLMANLGFVVDGRPSDIFVGDIFFASHDDEGETIGLNNFQVEWLSNRIKQIGMAEMTDGSEQMIYALSIFSSEF